MRYITPMLVLIALIMGACQPIVAQPKSAAPEQATISLEAQEDAVRAASAAWDAAFNAGDLDQLVALYAEDAVDLPPGLPALEGIDAIAGDLQYIHDEFDAHHETSILEIKISGDLAIERANYTMTLTPKVGGDTIAEVGKHIIVRQKVGDEWLVLWEIWNTNEPVAAEEAAADKSTSMDPMAEVKFYTSHAAHEYFGMIDLASGIGADVGKYENPEVEILRTGWFIPNGAIYEDTFYVIADKRLTPDNTADDAQARLGKVDMQTGAVEFLGSVIPLHVGALEIDPCGQVFTTGFTLPNQIGELFGDTNLYRVDRQDASLTLIGDTGLERIMDMSFDPDGTLWATVGNVLYTLDMATGTPTEMAKITGVEDDLEIMGIGFTSDGQLFGTTPFADGFYSIDPATGVVTEVGRHGLAFLHGGDIPMVPHNVGCGDTGD